MPASPSALPRSLPAWSWSLIPAVLACLAAPAFFVLRVPWVGWVLLTADPQHPALADADEVVTAPRPPGAPRRSAASRSSAPAR